MPLQWTVLREAAATKLETFTDLLPSHDGGLWIGGKHGLAKFAGARAIDANTALTEFPVDPIFGVENLERLSEVYWQVIKTPVGAPLTHPALRDAMMRAILDKDPAAKDAKQDQHGYRPLHRAVQSGQRKVFDLLLQRKAFFRSVARKVCSRFPVPFRGTPQDENECSGCQRR